MKASGVLLMLPLVCMAAPGLAAAEAPPAWAYPVNPPDFKEPPDDGSLRRVPGSAITLTLTQVRERFYSPDWHPGDHAPQPEIVARGRKPDVFACGYCHRADGPGGPENANLTGLPVDYMMQQLADFKSGARKSSVPDRGPTRLKTVLSKAATEEEGRAAAEFFAGVKPRSIVTIVETETVPKTFITGWHLAVADGGERESIGNRIIEVPEDLQHFVSRDARVRFVAYVPLGSIKRGEELASTGGNGQTAPCAVCHGVGLKGLGPIPRIAGLSPSYIVRQLYDFKHGTRAGTMSALMKPSVEKLSVDDMLVLAAYAASLQP